MPRETAKRTGESTKSPSFEAVGVMLLVFCYSVGGCRCFNVQVCAVALATFDGNSD